VSELNGDDNAYKGLYSVTKATAHKVKNVYYKGKTVCEIFIPLIVLGGKLFIGRLIDDKVEISEENNIPTFWRNNVLEAPHSTILVNTYDNIDSLVAKAKKEFDSLKLKLNGHQGLILEEINRTASIAKYLH
jgi:hypothetical protein